MTHTQTQSAHTHLQLSTVLNTAREIADHAHESGLESCFFHLSPDQLISLIDSALRGDLCAVSPHMWACIVDAQEASAYLSRAIKCETEHHSFQSQSYRLIATRKLAEAVSWLM